MINLKQVKKLPDSEFEIMRIIWQNEPPVTTNQIIKCLDDDHKWKAQTVLTLLSRLIDKEFLSTLKQGKERAYIPLINEQEYLQIETNNFVKKYHKNSITALINTFYSGNDFSEKDLEDLKKWLSERK